MQKLFVTIGRLEHDDNTSWVEGEIALAGFEVGYPTEIDENTCNKEVYERGYLVGVWKRQPPTASA